MTGLHLAARKLMPGFVWMMERSGGPGTRNTSVQEGLARLDHLREKGDSDGAFGWAHLKQATRWRSDGCQATAAE